jgi:hypothetical protein
MRIWGWPMIDFTRANTGPAQKFWEFTHVS